MKLCNNAVRLCLHDGQTEEGVAGSSQRSEIYFM